MDMSFVLFETIFLLRFIILFSISLTFVSSSDFLTKLLILGILFSTAVNAEVVAKPVILGVSFLIFVLRLLLVAKLLISGILSSIYFKLASYSVF